MGESKARGNKNAGADPWWPAARPPAPPGESEVHIFRVHLDRDQGRIHELFNTLSPEEKDRAQRLISLKERYRLIVARGTLREILAAYLKREPEALFFTEGKRGKPALADHYDRGFTRFNMSHSGSLALVAVAGGREVGVDVEDLSRRVRYLRVAKRFFAPAEAALVESLAEDKRKEGFLTIWTRKEAFLKAEGRGIGVSLREVEVPTGIPGPREPLAIKDAPGARGSWSLVELHPGEGFVASLVAEGEDFELKGFTWPE